eukprot:g917.t1
MSEMKKLSGGWYEVQDPSNEKVYYFNKKTKERSWTKPEGVEDAAEDTNVTEASKSADGDTAPAEKAAEKVEEKKKKKKGRDIGNGWKEVIVDGKKFYINKEKRQRQWEWPDDVPKEEGTDAGEDGEAADLNLPGPPGDDDFPGPPDDADLPGPPEGSPMLKNASKRAGLANLARETAQVKVTADDIEAARRRNKSAAKRDDFGKVNIRKLIDEDVDGDWSEYLFKDFAQDNFDLKKSGGFFGSSKLKVSDLVVHSTKTLSQGLLKRSNTTDEGKEEAAQMHKNILSYMGDRKSGKDQMGHTHKILTYALAKLDEDADDTGKKGKDTSEFPGLWDEIYCQLVKQTTGNTTLNKSTGYADSLVAGFQLLTLCAGSFKCTQSLYPYVMAHLDRAKRGKIPVSGKGPMKTAAEKRVKKLARRAQIRLRKTCMMKQRRAVPTQMEISAVINALPLMVRVYKLDESYETLPVNTHTTVQTLTKMMSLTLKCKDDSMYGIYEYDSDHGRRYLKANTRVLDVVAKWQAEADSEESKDAIRKGDHSARFTFEVHYFLDEVPEDDIIGNNLLYIQCHEAVRTQMYPLSLKGCLDLGALQLQEEFGDYKGERDDTMLKNSLFRYLPPRLIDDPSAYQDCFENITARWKKLKDLNFEPYDCQLTYLDMIRPSIWYGCQKFMVKSIAGSGEYPSGGVFLNVSSKHILVVDCDSGDILETILLSNIMAFGSKDTTLLFKVGNIVYQEKKCFITALPGAADEITDLIRTYQRQKFSSMHGGAFVGGSKEDS